MAHVVKVPFTGYVEIYIEDASNEEEAKTLAMKESESLRMEFGKENSNESFTLEFDFVEEVCKGNVFNGKLLKIEAEETAW